MILHIAAGLCATVVKGIMKYMVFIRVAVVFIILYMDYYCRTCVKLQRDFSPLKDKP